MRSKLLGLGVLAGFLATPLVARAEPMVGLKTQNRVVTFDSATPATLSADKAITGLDQNDTVETIDLRPETGKLYGFSSAGNVYTLAVGATSVVATKVSTAAIATTGTIFDIDFNPSSDALRLITNDGTNIRVNTTTLAPTTDTQLYYSAANLCIPPVVPVPRPQVVAVAYRHNFGGALPFSDATGSNHGMLQYAIDARNSRLIRIGNLGLNDGCTFDIGAGLGVTLDGAADAGFDISSRTGTAFAALTAVGQTGLYTINLESGAATLVGTFPTTDVKDIVAVGGPAAATAFGVTKLNELVRFDTSDPSVLTSGPTFISNIALNDTIVGIDFRPKDGLLYALAVNAGMAKIYTLDKATARATAVTTAAFPIEGNIFGMDFNPMVDAIRVVTDTAKNYRINPNTGALSATDTDLAYQDSTANPPFLTGSAYTNNAPGATSTRLFGIDTRRQVLAAQGLQADGGTGPGPNSGQLFAVAPTVVNTSNANTDIGAAGFDIAPNGTAYAVLSSGTPLVSRLYEVSLTPSTGPAVSYGRAINTAERVHSIAIEVPIPPADPDAGTPDSGTNDDAGADSGTTGDSGIADSGTPNPQDSGTGVRPDASSTVDSGRGPDSGSSPNDGEVGGGGDDGCGCSEAPVSRAAPSALALAIATLMFVRRRRNREV